MLLPQRGSILRKPSILYVVLRLLELLFIFLDASVAAHWGEFSILIVDRIHLFIIYKGETDYIHLSIKMLGLRKRVGRVLNDSAEQCLVKLAYLINFGRQQRHHLFVPMPQVGRQYVLVIHLNFVINARL